MEGLATIKLELGINAQRIIQQFQMHNKQLEDVLQKGIERALDEILSDNNFEDLICQTAKEKIVDQIKYAISDWSIRNKLQEAVRKGVENRIDNIADKWANKLLEDIK